MILTDHKKVIIKKSVGLRTPGSSPTSCVGDAPSSASTGVEPLLLLVSLQACTPGFPGAVEHFQSPFTTSFLL